MKKILFCRWEINKFGWIKLPKGSKMFPIPDPVWSGSSLVTELPPAVPSLTAVQTMGTGRGRCFPQPRKSELRTKKIHYLYCYWRYAFFILSSIYCSFTQSFIPLYENLLGTPLPLGIPTLLTTLWLSVLKVYFKLIKLFTSSQVSKFRRNVFIIIFQYR